MGAYPETVTKRPGTLARVELFPSRTNPESLSIFTEVSTSVPLTVNSCGVRSGLMRDLADRTIRQRSYLYSNVECRLSESPFRAASCVSYPAGASKTCTRKQPVLTRYNRDGDLAL